MLPDLSQLSVGHSVFDNVARKGGGKSSCNDTKSCDVDGFLMFKEIVDYDASPESFYTKPIPVTFQGRQPQSPVHWVPCMMQKCCHLLSTLAQRNAVYVGCSVGSMLLWRLPSEQH